MGAGPLHPATGVVHGDCCSCEVCEAIAGPGRRCHRPEVRTRAQIPRVPVDDHARSGPALIPQGLMWLLMRTTRAVPEMPRRAAHPQSRAP